MEEKNDRRSDKTIIIIILILIALIIIIFLLIKCIGLIDHRPRIPTGNVDIFDIVFENYTCMQGTTCNCGCHNNSNILCDNCKQPINNNNETTGDGNSDNDMRENIIVYDGNTKYSNNTELKIFTQTAYYVVEDKIAPTSENTYQFVIRNNNNFNIKYDLETEETNKQNINMKYRLKRNEIYVLGNDDEYVTIDKLKQYDIELGRNTYDVYSLDWKWFEGENDTKVGTDITSSYRLDVRIRAVQI